MPTVLPQLSWNKTSWEPFHYFFPGFIISERVGGADQKGPNIQSPGEYKQAEIQNRHRREERVSTAPLCFTDFHLLLCFPSTSMVALQPCWLPLKLRRTSNTIWIQRRIFPFQFVLGSDTALLCPVADHTRITWLIMHWSRGYHALITWLSCTDHVADHAMIT